MKVSLGKAANKLHCLFNCTYIKKDFKIKIKNIQKDL